MAKMKVIIEREVHEKVMYWVNKSQYEVSGFGNVLVEPDGTLRIISAVLTKQENSATDTDIKAADVAKALFETRDMQGEMRWWWHSHVNMGVFWSGTDHQAMRDFASTPDSWIVCTVFNKKNEKRSCFYAPQGCDTPWGKQSLLFDELPTELSADASKVAQWEAEYAAKVVNPPDKYRHPWAKTTTVQPLSKPVKPPGMSKKDWKQLQKKEAEKPKNVDEYGFNQVERADLTTMGWTLHDVDMLIAKGFTARQIVILCENDYLAEDVVQLIDNNGETVLSIMKDALAKKKQAQPLASDDAPVSRDKSVIDMRKGDEFDFNNPHDYYGYGYGGRYDG